MSDKLSYIIPVYNSKDTIKDTLDSVMKNKDVSEIILVDDCSIDGTREVIDRYLNDYNNIRYTRNDRRSGAGQSRNIGARMANGDILVFLDADIVIPPESSSIVKGYFLKDKINPQPDAIVGNRLKEAICKDAVSMYKNYWTSYNLSKLKGWTALLCSSFFAIKKDVFMDINGFSQISHAEDNDLGYRLFLNNYKIYFADDLAVSHKKRFSMFSLLKREFKAGKEGIKIKIKNKVLSQAIRDKKFFAVNKNFIYSFPFVCLFSLGIIMSILFLNPAILSIPALSVLYIVFLNREFLAYSSCSKNYAKGIFYIFLMIAQLNVIGLGMLLGLFELFMIRLAKAVFLIFHYSKSFIKLFLKSFFPPEQVTFFVTNRCNLNCTYCFVERSSQDKDRELKASEMDKMSKNMGTVNFVTVTGGEPFLREDIVEIVKILKKNLRPSLITILTNGYMADTVVSKIREILESCKGQDILVKTSLDGSPEIHDRMRQKKGAFAETYNAFVKLKNLKKIYRNLTLAIITTYTSQNKDYIESLYDKVISDLAPDQYGLALERPNKANKLNEKIDIDDYIRILKKLNIKTLSLTKGFFRKFRLAYKLKMTEKVKEIYMTKKYPMKCFAGVLNAVVSPNGDVFACEQLDSRLGNLREKDYDWKKIWHSPEARTIRGMIKKKGCFCTNECYMPFNLSYDIKELSGVLKTFIKGILLRRKVV